MPALRHRCKVERGGRRGREGMRKKKLEGWGFGEGSVFVRVFVFVRGEEGVQQHEE